MAMFFTGPVKIIALLVFGMAAQMTNGFGSGTKSTSLGKHRV
jgi:hypothetical protein